MVLVMQRVGRSLYKIKEPATARRNMGAVQDVAWGPEALRSGIIASIEQSIERVQDDLHVALFRFVHSRPLLSNLMRRLSEESLTGVMSGLNAKNATF